MIACGKVCKLVRLTGPWLRLNGKEVKVVSAMTPSLTGGGNGYVVDADWVRKLLPPGYEMWVARRNLVLVVDAKESQAAETAATVRAMGEGR